MPIASRIPTLESLSAPDLKLLKVRLQYDAYTTEKRINKLRQRLNRDDSRLVLLRAAQSALNTLRKQAVDILQALVQMNVDPALIAAQQAQVDKYERELEKLSSAEVFTPSGKDIHIHAMRIAELEHRLQHLTDEVASINLLLGEGS
ncbi:MAG: hypothetical protein R2813_00615 [Flavobacteriales bacterium]